MQTCMLPVEHTDTQLAFQLGQCLRNRTFRHEQYIRRTGHSSVPRDGDENRKLF